MLGLATVNREHFFQLSHVKDGKFTDHTPCLHVYMATVITINIRIILLFYILTEFDTFWHLYLYLKFIPATSATAALPSFP